MSFSYRMPRSNELYSSRFWAEGWLAGIGRGVEKETCKMLRFDEVKNDHLCGPLRLWMADWHMACC